MFSRVPTLAGKSPKQADIVSSKFHYNGGISNRNFRDSQIATDKLLLKASSKREFCRSYELFIETKLNYCLLSTWELFSVILDRLFKVYSTQLTVELEMECCYFMRAKCVSYTWLKVEWTWFFCIIFIRDVLNSWLMVLLEFINYYCTT